MRPTGVADLRAYERAGGYQAIRKVLRAGMTPKAVTEVVKDSNLRGRGGAGFQTGLKWSFVPFGKDVPNPTYLVVNGDEMEPGTFKDRLLMERDPHQLIEGAIVAAFAIEADIAYIFLRGEYTLAAERLARAIAEAYKRQYLGKDIFGSGYSLELYLHLSGGRYICGDETGPPERAGRQARQSEIEAAVSAVGRTVRQTHSRQQRGDALLRASHHQPRCDVVSWSGED